MRKRMNGEVEKEGLIVVKIKSASVEYTGKVDICSSSNCMEIWLDL